VHDPLRGQVRWWDQAIRTQALQQLGAKHGPQLAAVEQVATLAVPAHGLRVHPAVIADTHALIANEATSARSASPTTVAEIRFVFMAAELPRWLRWPSRARRDLAAVGESRRATDEAPSTLLRGRGAELASVRYELRLHQRPFAAPHREPPLPHGFRLVQKSFGAADRPTVA